MGGDGRCKSVVNDGEAASSERAKNSRKMS